MGTHDNATGPLIFISYRRVDTVGHAKTLYHKVRDYFGADRVFYDAEDITAGDRFHEVIERALSRSAVTLAVIGPGWLDELNKRQRESPGDVDVVRKELALALALSRPPGPMTVIPVLVGNNTSRVKAAKLPDELAELGTLDEVVLDDGKQATWEFVMRGLLLKIAKHANVLPLPTASDQARMEAVREAVHKLLTKPELAPLRANWAVGDAQPLTGARLEDVNAVLEGYAQALYETSDDWPKTTESEVVRKHCRAILGHLYSMAVVGDRARLLTDGAAHGSAVPVASAGALAFACAVVHGKQVRMTVKPESPQDFQSEDTVDLGHVETGVGADRSVAVQKAFWALAFANPRRAYPGNPSNAGALDAAALKTLQDRLKARSKAEKRLHLVTEIAAPHGGTSDLAIIAQALDVLGVARTGSPEGKALLRVAEATLHVDIVYCLDLIEKIGRA